MNEETKHIPVLLNEVVTSLADVSGFIVDCTLGRGGHFFELLKHHDNLVGLDADLSSIDYVRRLLVDLGYREKNISENIYELILDNKKVYLAHSNFSELSEVINKLKVPVGGILADLGISMFQLKDSARGFTFANAQEALDMRINTFAGPTASELLNSLSQKEIEMLFKNLGEVSGYKEKARKIVEHRKYKRINTVGDLLNVLNLKKKPGQRVHPATKVFMALRIAVNREHLNLNVLLNSSYTLLDTRGVLCVITFHSLEENTVNKFINKLDLKNIVSTPTKQELVNNKSSRSAKLYAITKK